VTTGSAALRVGRAERQQAVELLKDGYADGRLDQAELEQRTEHALTARTASDLDAVLSDLGAASAITATRALEIPSRPAGRLAQRACEQAVRLMRWVFCCGG